VACVYRTSSMAARLHPPPRLGSNSLCQLRPVVARRPQTMRGLCHEMRFEQNQGVSAQMGKLMLIFWGIQTPTVGAASLSVVALVPPGVHYPGSAVPPLSHMSHVSVVSVVISLKLFKNPSAWRWGARPWEASPIHDTGGGTPPGR